MQQHNSTLSVSSSPSYSAKNTQESPAEKSETHKDAPKVTEKLKTTIENIATERSGAVAKTETRQSKSGNRSHSSLSVSLVKLDSTLTHPRRDGDHKGENGNEGGVVVDSVTKSTALPVSTSTPSAVPAPVNNGVTIINNEHPITDEQERSFSSTPEIPILTTPSEVMNHSAVSNCITLHTTATAMGGRTSSPILTNGTTGGGVQVHRAADLNNIPPGTKMVPVKLVSVPGGDGNMPGMRLVRVSPVKSHPSMHQGHQGGIAVVPNTLGAVPGTRTVVIKSSMLKSATTVAMAQAAAHQNSTIISTATSSNSALISSPISSTSSGPILAGSSALAMNPNPSPLPPHLVTSQPISPSLLLNASQNAISAPPTSVLKASTTNTSTSGAIPSIINHASEHTSAPVFAISNHNSSTTVELIPNSSVAGLSSTNPPAVPISVPIGKRSVAASVVPVPAMHTISAAAASVSGVGSLLGPSLSITPVEVGTSIGPSLLSSKGRTIGEPCKPSSAILNSVLASMATPARGHPEPSPIFVTGVSKNQIGATIVESPVGCTVQTPASVTVSLKPKITEALKIDTKVKGLGSRGRAAKSPQRHHSNGDDFGGGGSLLRPLLQKEEPATTITTHLEIGTSAGAATTVTTATLQKGKQRRRRHDTGSSTKSDKSDISSSETPSNKKSKVVTATTDKKSQLQNNSSPVTLSPAASKTHLGALSPSKNDNSATTALNANKTTAKGARGKDRTV